MVFRFFCKKSFCSRKRSRLFDAIQSPLCQKTRREGVFFGVKGFSLSDYIFSGALTPSRPMPLASTERTVSASFSRAPSTWGSSPLMRQAL